MSKRIEYHIHYANGEFEIVAPNQWRFAKKLAQECIEGTRKDIVIISRVEYGPDWLEEMDHTDLFYKEGF